MGLVTQPCPIQHLCGLRGLLWCLLPLSHKVAAEMPAVAARLMERSRCMLATNTSPISGSGSVPRNTIVNFACGFRCSELGWVAPLSYGRQRSDLPWLDQPHSPGSPNRWTSRLAWWSLGCPSSFRIGIRSIMLRFRIYITTNSLWNQHSTYKHCTLKNLGFPRWAKWHGSAGEGTDCQAW